LYSLLSFIKPFATLVIIRGKVIKTAIITGTKEDLNQKSAKRMRATTGQTLRIIKKGSKKYLKKALLEVSQPSKKPAMALIKKADRILTRLSKNESQKPPDKIKRKAVRRVRPGEGRIKSELIK